MNAPTQVPVKQGAAPLSRPFSHVFGSLHREIDRLFEDFTPAFAATRGAAEVRCKMDVAETGEGLELTVELPGLEEKDVEVSISDGLLTISGEKHFAAEQADKHYRLVERGYGSFTRSIDLPLGVKAEGIKASLNKGVLKVTIPTPVKPKPKKIEIQAAG